MMMMMCPHCAQSTTFYPTTTAHLRQILPQFNIINIIACARVVLWLCGSVEMRGGKTYLCSCAVCDINCATRIARHAQTTDTHTNPRNTQNTLVSLHPIPPHALVASLKPRADQSNARTGGYSIQDLCIHLYITT